MKLYFPYDLENPQTVIGEQHRIIAGKIRLEHVPLDGSIEIAGFSAAKSRARLLSNEFFCEYRADTLYREANRVVYFHSDNNFRTVYVNYKAVGTPFTAEDANEIPLSSQSGVLFYDSFYFVSFRFVKLMPLPFREGFPV